MTTIETTAKTPEEAIEIALKELDVSRAEVEINVISKGKTGILGIGGEPSRVRVTLLEETSDVVRVATQILDDLISKMGVSATARLRHAVGPDLGGPVFDIDGDDSGLLIGRKGETLRALQFIVNLLAGSQMDSRARILIDVAEYQEHRYKALANLARSVAQRVASSGRPITLEPMPPNERRIVHLTLTDHVRVTTESTGTGAARQVVVSPNLY